MSKTRKWLFGRNCLHFTHLWDYRRIFGVDICKDCKLCYVNRSRNKYCVCFVIPYSARQISQEFLFKTVMELTGRKLILTWILYFLVTISCKAIPLPNTTLALPIQYSEPTTQSNDKVRTVVTGSQQVSQFTPASFARCHLRLD